MNKFKIQLLNNIFYVLNFKKINNLNNFYSSFNLYLFNKK